MFKNNTWKEAYLEERSLLILEFSYIKKSTCIQVLDSQFNRLFIFKFRNFPPNDITMVNIVLIFVAVVNSLYSE